MNKMQSVWGPDLLAEELGIVKVKCRRWRL